MKHKPIILRSECGFENHQLIRKRKSRKNEKFAHSLVPRDTGPSNAPLPESLRLALSVQAHPIAGHARQEMFVSPCPKKQGRSLDCRKRLLQFRKAPLVACAQSNDKVPH